MAAGVGPRRLRGGAGAQASSTRRHSNAVGPLCATGRGLGSEARSRCAALSSPRTFHIRRRPARWATHRGRQHDAAAGGVGRPATGPIARLLANVACEQYADALRERGWDDMETLKRASWLDLVNIGMKPGHARRFYAELHGTREG